MRELEARAPFATSHAGRLVSVFFGGGTPSLFEPAALGSVLRAVRAAFGEEAPDLEVTVECNPTSLDRARAAAFAEVGVNRLSVGVQSTSDAHLGYLGRLHDGEGALRALRAARLELERVSADLMFGMADQSVDAFAREVETVLDTGVQHVSAYALTIEPNTQFGALHKKGRLTVATDDTYADSFARAEALFASRGLEHYEVSNYARPGEEARHNQHYWGGGDYLGLGAGAVGALSDRETTRRYRNESHPERYMAATDLAGFEAETETLDADARIREALMLGLRTREGVDLQALAARTGQDPRAGREEALARREARGDVVLDGDVLRVPAARWLHLDGIVADLF